MPEQRHEQELDELQREADRPSRPLWVNIYADEKDGGVVFTHDWRLKKDGPIEGKGEIIVPFGTPRSPIHFHLHDKTGRQLKFPADAQQAIWAAVGKCPGGEGGGGQIEYKDAVSGGPTLKVNNANSADCELHYALRFEDKDGNIEPYDPVIRDKGGGP
jgi:hypothetical protein